MIRAFAIVLLAGVLAATMPASAPAVATPSGSAALVAGSVAGSIGAGSTDDDTTRPTLNEFLPEERSLSDCLGALQRPNCGSEARGGWAQTTVFLLIVAALGFIAWRVVAGSRRARRRSAGTDRVTPGTPGATTARDAGDGDPAP